MKIPLALLHIPALVVYLTSEDVRHDMFTRRQNACLVLDEFVKCASNPFETLDLKKAVEKCRGSVKCPGQFAAKTLLSLHDALCKNTPSMKRPVSDPEDTCDLEVWNTERSFVREVFGMQVERDGKVDHVMSVELPNTGNSLAKCLRDALGNATVKRVPLILVVTKNPKKFIDYPFEFDFSGVKYVLKAVSTQETSLYEKDAVWYAGADTLETMNDLVTKEACVIVYYRK